MINVDQNFKLPQLIFSFIILERSMLDLLILYIEVYYFGETNLKICFVPHSHNSVEKSCLAYQKGSLIV